MQSVYKRVLGSNERVAYACYNEETKKISDVYVADASTRKLVYLGFTTGSFADNFTLTAGKHRVELYVFGAAKLAAHMKFVRELSEDSTVTIKATKTSEEQKLTAFDYVKTYSFGVIDEVNKLAKKEADRVKEGKEVRFGVSDPLVNFCAEFDKTSRDHYMSSFSALQGWYLATMGFIMDFLPHTHQVVAKMGVGRGVEFNSLDECNSKELNVLETAVALVRASFAMHECEADRVALFMACPVTQEYSIDDDLWARRAKNLKLKGSLDFFHPQTEDPEWISWFAEDKGEKLFKLGSANLLAKALIEEAFQPEPSPKRQLISPSTIRFLDECGWVDWFNRMTGTRDVLNPYPLYDNAKSDMVRSAIAGELDVVKIL